MKQVRIFSWLLSLIVIAGLITAATKATAIEDWFKLRNYTPPTNIATLASQDTMTAYTRHMFYINHPQLVSGVANFRQNDCPENENTIVLGCYHSGQNGIFIYKVTDPELYGVEQVTAAHEVLHTIYARLSDSERTQLDNELNSYYKNGLHDQRVLDEVKLYQQTEPGSVLDEMSCTFGTEIASLPAPLEAYYAKYFSNRQAIISYEQSYESAFTKHQAQVAADDAQLASLKARITAQEANLQTESGQINADRARLDSERSNGQTDDYNSGVPAFNAEIDTYNQGVSQLQANIASYNSLVTARNAIAADLASLAAAIDTRLTTQPTQ